MKIVFIIVSFLFMACTSSQVKTKNENIAIKNNIDLKTMIQKLYGNKIK